MKDDEVWAAIFGGILGYALGKPKPEEQQEIEEYKRIKSLINIRRQSIGELPSIEKLRGHPEVYNLFVESYQMYLYGFFRASSVFCASTIEHALRIRYKENKRFYELIKNASKEGIITESEKSYLTGLRLDRNKFLHEITNEVKEEDARLILLISKNILNKVL